MTKRKIAVLMTCHNRSEKTISCLTALFSSKLSPDFEILVYLVDDGCTDDTNHKVSTLFPSVNIIRGDGGLFWNRGMHVAWSTAIKVGYEYYFWLNDDTLLLDGALMGMLDASKKKNDSCIIVGTTHGEADDTRPTYGGYIKEYCVLYPDGNLQKCHWFNGNCVLIPRHVSNKIGINDKKFRHALGDFEYGIRAAKAGIESYVAAKFIGVCELHDSDPLWRNKNVSLVKRLKHLYSPLGCNPFEYFYFDRNRYGLLYAIFHFFSIHIRSFFPAWWAYLLKRR